VQVKEVVTIQPHLLVGQSLAEALKKIRLVKDICKSIEDRAKAELMRDPASVPGFGLKQGRKARSIKDPQAAYNAVSKVIDGGEFASCCKVSIPQLEELYRVKAGCPVKTAKQEIATMLNGIIEETVSASTIEEL
jgi:hypothetical protein